MSHPTDSTLGTLTEIELRRLYLDEGMTDSEIADLHNTLQPYVSRLRKKLGIVTILKSDRRKLPSELSSRQKSILLGSMLGDGGLRPSGRDTARYEESHCAQQLDYLKWKESEWGPFSAGLISADKGQYKGFRLLTFASRTLFPYWETFYPEGKGNKIFHTLNIEDVDSLALAVWFMDDGSKGADFFRFSVGPDARNQQVQMKALKKFGFSPVKYGSGGDVAIHLMGSQNVTKFVDLVAPHIVPTMSYKLSLSVVRKAGVPPRELLTKEKLEPLLARGLTALDIAKVFRVSRQSVGRALARIGVTLPSGRPAVASTKEYDLAVASELLKNLDRQSENFLGDAVKVLSRTVIPVPMATKEELGNDVRLLRNAPTHMSDDGVVHSLSKAGSLTCMHYFPHRWDARYRDNPSVREAWYDPKMLGRAIRFQVAVGDPVTPVRVFRALQAVVRAPTNFRPSLAKAIIDKYCKPGGLVLDPCAGYGGRAVASLASGRGYIGVDPNPKSKESFQGLVDLLGGDCTFINQPFEDALLSTEADLVFTSPPYFSVERYADDATQSWVRYRTWTEWVEGFLAPFVAKAHANLKVGCYFIVNTKDIKMRGKVLSIPSELLRLSQGQFDHTATMSLTLGRLGKVAQQEPLLVFRKK
jgi:hypothetical protein